jgi:hypothetical protein
VAYVVYGGTTIFYPVRPCFGFYGATAGAGAQVRGLEVVVVVW